jgi:hypothetical protein
MDLRSHGITVLCATQAYRISWADTGIKVCALSPFRIILRLRNIEHLYTVHLYNLLEECEHLF